jgi:uncharacterized protein
MSFAPSLILTFSLLALSVCAVWFDLVTREANRPLHLWLPLFVAAIISGLSSGYLTWPSIVVLGSLVVAAFFTRREQTDYRVRVLFLVFVVLISIGLALHQMPGFHNPILIANTKFSPDAAPYTQYANFDKTAAGLLVLVFFCNRARSTSDWREVLRSTYPVALATAFIVIAAGLLLGYAKLDIKLPAYTPIFLVTNLLFTCVAEEAFFRGFLQHRLAKYFESKNVSNGRSIALVGSALLFGAVHTGGGFGYVVLATLAGLGYGYAYARVERIEAPILVHFSVNTVHFLGFTYPRIG